MKIKLFLLFLFCQKVVGQDVSWAKTFSGMIDKYPITMHLHKAKNGYHGTYFYDKVQEIVPFSGTEEKGVLKLTAYSSPNNKEVFSATLANGELTGTWKNVKKTLHFSAKEVQNQAIAFDYVIMEGEKKLKKGTEEFTADFHTAAVWAKNNDAINTLIRKEFEDKSSRTISEVFFAKKKAFLKESEFNPKDNLSLNFVDDKIDIFYFSANLIVLSHRAYYFEGGLYGNYVTNFLPILLKNNQILKLNDIFSPNNLKELPKLVEAAFRQKNNLSPKAPLTDAGLFKNKIAPNDNFYLTEKGIGFVYNPEEIAPHVVGNFEVFVPFSKFSGGMKLF